MKMHAVKPGMAGYARRRPQAALRKLNLVVCFPSGKGN
jgi:hypothetical protein